MLPWQSADSLHFQTPRGFESWEPFFIPRLYLPHRDHHSTTLHHLTQGCGCFLSPGRAVYLAIYLCWLHLKRYFTTELFLCVKYSTLNVLNWRTYFFLPVFLHSKQIFSKMWATHFICVSIDCQQKQLKWVACIFGRGKTKKKKKKKVYCGITL